MNLPNESLGDRLNSFREKKLNPTTNPKDNVSIPNKFNYLIIGLFEEILKLIIPVVYGFSIKIIFNAPWNLWETLCIGISINLLLSYIQNLIHKS